MKAAHLDAAALKGRKLDSRSWRRRAAENCSNTTTAAPCTPSLYHLKARRPGNQRFCGVLLMESGAQKMTRNCPPSICKASKFSFAALRRPPKRPPERFANILLRPNNIEINIALTGDWFHSVSRGVPIRLDPDLCRHHGRYPVKYTIGPATSAMTERADTSHPSNGQKCMLLTQ
jgi:hypothetical protein